MCVSCNASCGVARAGGGAQLKFMVHPCRSLSVTVCNGGPYEVDSIPKMLVFVDNKHWLQVTECDFSGALESRVNTALCYTSSNLSYQHSASRQW